MNNIFIFPFLLILVFFSSSFTFLSSNNPPIVEASIGEPSPLPRPPAVTPDPIPVPPFGEPTPQPTNPFTSAEGSPEIVLEYQNNTYDGQKRSVIFESGDVNENMPTFGESSSNITAIIPDEIITIPQNGVIHLSVEENPQPELQPYTISATAYNLKNITENYVLSIKEDPGDRENEFVINLNTGEYILLATATWIPDADNYLLTSGYITYVFRLNVL